MICGSWQLKIRTLHASQTTKIRGAPFTVVTSLFGYVAIRKSFACRNPPNGIAFGSTATTCSAPKTPLPGAVSVRSLIVKTCPSGNCSGSSSPSIRAHVM